MKKVLLVLCLYVLVGSAYADDYQVFEGINLQVNIIDPSIESKPIKKSPIRIPSLGINGYTIYYLTPCDGCTLQLLNSNGDIEYSVVIPDNTMLTDLPTYLSGEFEIQVIRGKYCFYGYISL